ncbi:inactive protein RESTRICTED TEV MOVEMENT 2-like [Musa acuminata AAA Group]|uniref:inactive protein RESTRICTED TEV MOVEMENT 2-like n=1 Tax=Musa acuminata AAA Group TaxID=214697 RepID=UPI0031D18226
MCFHFSSIGFVKEELNVQLDSDGRVVVSGQRPTMDGRWSRFRKEFRVPENCVLDKISAKFENGLLHLVFPKSITKPSPQDDGSIRKQGREEEQEKVGKQEKDQVKEDKPRDGEKKAAGRGGVGLRLRQMKLEMGRLERELRDTRNCRLWLWLLWFQWGWDCI